MMHVRILKFHGSNLSIGSKLFDLNEAFWYKMFPDLYDMTGVIFVYIKCKSIQVHVQRRLTHFSAHTA